MSGGGLIKTISGDSKSVPSLRIRGEPADVNPPRDQELHWGPGRNLRNDRQEKSLLSGIHFPEVTSATVF